MVLIATTHREITGRFKSSQKTKRLNQQKLNPQQEEELVRYIKRFTDRHIHPSRDVIRNYAIMEKALQPSQKGKRKASQPFPQIRKRQKRVVNQK
jgi:hemerythrin-like domain-containing protein